jgi:type II secretory pathway component PulF
MAISINKKLHSLAAKDLSIQAPKHASRVNKWQEMIRPLGRSIKTQEIFFFISQLSLMLELGTPLINALNLLENQIKNPAFKEVIQAMLKDLQEGHQLSEALRRHPRVFNNVFVSMIKAGETGGFSKEILRRVVEMQEKRHDLVTKIRSAITYPLVLCILGVIVVIFVMVGILPKFTLFFEGKEHILPFTTRFLMIMSASLRGFWWAYLVGGVGLVFAFKFFKNSEAGQILIDRFYVSGPITASLFNKIYTCQMLRILGHLLDSSVPLVEALEVTRVTISNRYYQRFIEQIVSHVKQGGRFSQPFATYPYIMESVKQMVATGEEVGALPSVMLRLAEFYDGELDRRLKTLSSMIEPLALIVIGGVVGLIVSSVILPLFRLSHAIH